MQAQYAELTKNVTQLRNEALTALAQNLDGDVILVNATSFTQPGLVLISGDSLQRLTREGKVVPIQEADLGLWVDAGEIPSYSLIALSPTRAERTLSAVEVEDEAGRNETAPSNNFLENNYLRVEFNDDGDITRILDKKAQREVLAPDSVGNQFQAFEDRPKSWDAWDVDIFYDDKLWLAEPASSIKMIEYGELRQTIEIQRRILNSFYTQRISLNHNSPRLDFATHIEWNERHIMLKVAFPVDVLASQATYEI